MSEEREPQQGPPRVILQVIPASCTPPLQWVAEYHVEVDTGDGVEITHQVFPVACWALVEDRIHTIASPGHPAMMPGLQHVVGMMPDPESLADGTVLGGLLACDMYGVFIGYRLAEPASVTELGR